MSANYKNTNNYTALLNEIKATTLNDKIKGRNQKINLKRNQSQSGEKSENFPLKTVTNSTNCEINQKYASMDFRSLEKKNILNGITPVINDYNTKQIDPMKKRNQSISNLGQNSSNVGNKIDIKISVNYNKPNITNSVNFANSNSSSGLSSSKSFYHTPGNLQNMTPINSVNPYMQSHNKTSYTHEADLIKNKINLTKPENNFNTSSISEEKIKEKLLEHTSQIGKNSLATSALNLNHLRNRSQNLLDQNTLNISLMGCENKNLKNYLINQSHMNMSINNYNNINNFNNTSNFSNSNNSKVHNNNNFNNKKLVFSHYKYPSVDKSTNHSFGMNNKLFNYINKNPEVQKRTDINNQSCIKNKDTTENQNTTEGNPNLNVISTEMDMKDFTLNKNNDELSHLVDKMEKQQDTENNLSVYKFMILETNLEDQLSNLKHEREKEKDLKDKERGLLHLNQNAISLLNKKFWIYKKASEEYISLTQGENNKNINLLQKLFQGYNEIINNLITHHTEKMTEQENITTNYKIVSKKYSDLYKAFKEKSEELKALKSKINQVNSKVDIDKAHSIIDLSLNLSNSNIKNTEMGTYNNNNNNNNNLNTTTTNFENYAETVNDTQGDVNRSRMIKMMNKNVLDDLDAIYFFDKINMRANSASHKKIPKLDFNFLEKDIEKEKEKIKNNQIQKKVKEEILENKKDHGPIQNNQMEKLKHNKKTSLLKLEDLIVLPDKEKLIPANSVINNNKHLGLLSINNQNGMSKYSNYYSNNLLKSNGVQTKKFQSQDFKITNKQTGGLLK